MFSYYLDKAETREFMRRCVAIRRALTAYLAFGEMFRPPTFLDAVPKVTATTWKTDTRYESPVEFDAVEETGQQERVSSPPDGEL